MFFFSVKPNKFYSLSTSWTIKVRTCFQQLGCGSLTIVIFVPAVEQLCLHVSVVALALDPLKLLI